MEQLIEKLLRADSDTIRQSTKILEEAFNQPSNVVQSVSLVLKAKRPEYRQYAALLLSKHLNEQRWRQLGVGAQNNTKQVLLDALLQEHTKSVRHAVAQLVSILMHYETEQDGAWVNEVFLCMFNSLRSSDLQECSMGAAIFATLADNALDMFEPYLETTFNMLKAALAATEAHNDSMYTSIMVDIFQGITFLVPLSHGNAAIQKILQDSLPAIIKTMQIIAENDDDAQNFVNAFDVLESIVEFIPKLLSSTIKQLVEFCVSIAANDKLNEGKRIKVVIFLCWLVRFKKSTIIKLQKLDTLLQLIFELMATMPDQEAAYDDPASNLVTATMQAMSVLSFYMPAEKLFPTLLKLLESALQSADVMRRRAVYLTIAVISEGCSEIIVEKYLHVMFAIIQIGLTEYCVVVRNATFFALGQFFEHLEPHMSEYGSEFLPILLKYLQTFCNDLSAGICTKHAYPIFSTLQTFCEHLKIERLKPYLPIIMGNLFEAMNPNYSPDVRKLAMDVIAATVTTVRDDFMPYFENVISLLRPYLKVTNEQEILELRLHAIETLTALAASVSNANFLPLANETMQFALDLLKEITDPYDICAVYNLLGALSAVLNENMVNVLPDILKYVYSSIKESEVPRLGVNAQDIENSIGMDMEDCTFTREYFENFDIAGVDLEDSNTNNVGDAYLEEKLEAIEVLKAFAVHTGPAFMPHLEKAFQRLDRLIDHPVMDIRKLCIGACTVFIIALKNQNRHKEAEDKVIEFLPKLARLLCFEEEISVALQIFNSMNKFLKYLKILAACNEQITELIVCSMEDALRHKLACQIYDEDNENDVDYAEEDSQHEFALIQAAAVLLPLLGKVLAPDKFLVYFERTYHLIFDKMQISTERNEVNVLRRTTLYCVFGPSFRSLGLFAGNYFDIFMPIFLNGLRESSTISRKNAIWGLGELVICSKQKSYSSFPEILGSLSSILSTETNPYVLDSICGAIARLIITNNKLMPMEQVLPALMQYLPLREDFAEYTIIFECLNHLYISVRDIFFMYLEHIIDITVQVLYHKQFEKDSNTPLHAHALLIEMRNNYTNKFNAIILKYVDPDLNAFLQQILMNP